MCSKTASNSVFNAYHYFNAPGEYLGDDDQAACANCNEHCDPGHVTVLGKATSSGLEVCDAASGEYVCVEQLLETLVGMDTAVVIVGETVSRATRSAFPACTHRVRQGLCPRVNVVYELRPIKPLWRAWE